MDARRRGVGSGVRAEFAGPEHPAAGRTPSPGPEEPRGHDQENASTTVPPAKGSYVEDTHWKLERIAAIPKSE
jgi:hypothetical protein